MNILAILWDLDGVLVDTGEFHYLAWADTFKSLNIPFSRKLFQHTFGMNNWDLLNTLLGSPPDRAYYEQISLEKEAHFREIIFGQAKPLPGVLQTLEFFKSSQLHQAIASSAPPGKYRCAAGYPGSARIF